MPIPSESKNLKQEAKNALLCIEDADLRNLITRQLDIFGYTVRSTRLALEIGALLKSSNFQLVFLYDREAGNTAPLNSTLSAALTMTPEERRELFVVLAGPNMLSGNELQAFSLSANLTINIADLPHLGDHLSAALQRNTEFYKIYHESEFIAKMNV